METSVRTHLLHGAHHHHRLDGLRRRHGNGCWGDGHSDVLAVLGGELAGLGQALGGGLRGQGELEEGQRDGGLLQPRRLGHVLLLPRRPVLHLDARVHGLVAPQVVAVLELLVAGGADVGGADGFGERLD